CIENSSAGQLLETNNQASTCSRKPSTCSWYQNIKLRIHTTKEVIAVTKNMKKTSLFNKTNLLKLSALAASVSLALTACSQGSAEEVGGSDSANNESGEAQNLLTLSEEELREKLPSSIVD